MRKMYIILLAVILFGTANVSEAAMSGRAPMGLGAIVAGCCGYECAYSTGLLATPMGVKMAFGWFEQMLKRQIKKSAQSYQDGLKKELSTINKSFEAQNSKFRQLFTGFGIAGSHFRNSLIYGKQSRAYSIQRRSDYGIGLRGSSELNRRINSGVGNYTQSFGSNKEIAKRYQNISSGKISPQAVFPGDSTLSRKQAGRLYSSLKTMVDAFPASELPDKLKGSELEGAYRSVRKLKRFRSAVAQAVLLDVMSGYMPTVPTKKGIKKMYQRAGGKGEIPQVENGRISQVGYLDFLVKTRFANEQYRTGKQGIHSMTPSGLLRELTSVQALRLEIEIRKMRRARQISFLTAEEIVGKTLDTSLELQEMYQKILSE